MKTRGLKKAVAAVLSCAMILSTGAVGVSAADVAASGPQEAALGTWVVDDATRGNWIGVYGRDGYSLSGWNDSTDQEDLPYYIDTVEYINGSGGPWLAEGDTADINALQSPDDPDGNRRFSQRYNWGNTQSVRIRANDDDLHEVSIYVANPSVELDQKQTVQMFKDGNAITDEFLMEDLFNGKYVTTLFQGSVDIVITKKGPSSGYTLLNAVFFDSDYGDTIPVKRLSIAPVDGEIVRTELGTVQMNAAILPRNATDPSVTWSVVADDPEVASIDENGLLTISKAGNFKVKAVSNSNPEIADELTFASVSGLTTSENAEISNIGQFAIIQNKYVRVIFDTKSGYYSAYDQSTDRKSVV